MIIIYDTELKGHHLEYIHHLWTGIAKEYDGNDYTFVIPKEGWQKLRHLMSWPSAKNIHLRLLTTDELKCNTNFPILKRSRWECLLIRKLIKEFDDIQKIILLNLSVAMPLLPLYVPHHIKVDGIIYTLAYYTQFKWIRKIKEQFILKRFAKNRIFNKVYLLNSSKAVDFYNQQYNTIHFHKLIDPVPTVDFTKVTDLRTEMGISLDSIVFLHFGAMQIRKGTLEILKAIIQLDNKKKRVFIFAGKIHSSIHNEFYKLVDHAIDRGVQVIIKDEFVKFDELNNLCYTSDCILAPYLDTACSSGVIGYGAVFRKPVIGSEDGLLGELINDNTLGITIPVNANILAQAIESFNPYIIDSMYLKTNTVERFQDTILGRNFRNQINNCKINE